MPETIAYLEAIVGADVSDFRRGMRQVRGDIADLGGLSSSLRDLGRDLTYALTIPLVAAGAAALKVASDFDSSMRNVNSLLQLNESQFQSLEKTVRDYGSTIRAGPVEASKALYQIVSAGITDQATAMAILTNSNAAAEAGQANLETTTKALTTTMLAYSASADQASMYSNVLTRTVQLGVGSMDDFTAVLGRVAPSAATIGVTFQEVGETMAFLTQRGLSAAMSASSLNSALNTMIKPGTQLQSVFAQLGVSSGTELISKFGGLEGAIKALYGAVGNKGDVLAQMFTAQGRRAVLDIVNDLPAFNGLIDQFGNNLSGATSGARAEQLKSFAAQFDLMKSAIEGAAIVLGDKLMPLVAPLMADIKNLALGLERANPNLVSAAVGIGLVVAAIGPAITILGALITPIGLVAGLVTGLGLAFSQNFGGIRDTVTKAIDGTLPALRDLEYEFNKILSALTFTPPADAWIANLPLMNAQPTGSMGRQFGRMDNAAGTTNPVSGVLNQMPGVTPAVSTGEQTVGPFTSLGDRMSNAINAALPGIKSALSLLFSEIKDWILNTGIPSLSNLTGKLIGSLSNLVLDGVNGGLNLAWMLLSGQINTSQATGSLTTYLDNNVATPFRDGFNSVFDPTKLASTVNIGQKIFDFIGQKLDEVKVWIVGGGLQTAFNNLVLSVYNAIHSAFISTKPGQLSLAEQFTNWLGNLPYQLVNAIKNLFAGGKNGGGFNAGTAFGSLLSDIGDWFLNSFVPGVAGILGTALGMLAGLLTQLIAGIVSFVQTGSMGGIGDSLSSLGQSIGNNFLTGVSNGFNATANQGLVSSVQNTIGQLGALQQYNNDVGTGRTPRPNGQARSINSNPIGGTATGLIGSDAAGGGSGIAQKGSNGAGSPIAQALGLASLAEDFQNLVVTPIQTKLNDVKTFFINAGNDISTKVTDLFNTIGITIQSAFVTAVNAVIGMINGAMQAVSGFLGQIIQKIIDLVGTINTVGANVGVHVDPSGLVALQQSIANFTPLTPVALPTGPAETPIPTQNLGSVVAGNRAIGGQVEAGRHYRVSDGAGAELFVPGMSGNITTLSDLLAMVGGTSHSSPSDSGSHHNVVYINQQTDVDKMLFELKRRGIDLKQIVRQ